MNRRLLETELNREKYHSCMGLLGFNTPHLGSIPWLDAHYWVRWTLVRLHKYTPTGLMSLDVKLTWSLSWFWFVA